VQLVTGIRAGVGKTDVLNHVHYLLRICDPLTEANGQSDRKRGNADV